MLIYKKKSVDTKEDYTTFVQGSHIDKAYRSERGLHCNREYMY